MDGIDFIVEDRNSIDGPLRYRSEYQRQKLMNTNSRWFNTLKKDIENNSQKGVIHDYHAINTDRLQR